MITEEIKKETLRAVARSEFDTSVGIKKAYRNGNLMVVALYRKWYVEQHANDKEKDKLLSFVVDGKILLASDGTTSIINGVQLTPQVTERVLTAEKFMEILSINSYQTTKIF